MSNYPPFAYWTPEQLPAVEQVLSSPPIDDRPLGIYIHIPFCRKRCDFCYFKVYTDKNSSEIRRYLGAVVSELDGLVKRPYLEGRKPRFIYFGGGTPSYLSAAQMRSIFASLRDRIDMSEVEEITYECEPGTLSLAKIEALKEVGVTRLSLGVENFNPEVLELNNRAHRADEIHRTYGFARQVGFEAINIDLIAGMIGETEENWADCIERTLKMAPDCVTVYQMEVPYNTTMYKRMKESGTKVAPVASWEAKRRWHAELFRQLFANGYHRSSAYTACRGEDTRFLYRDALWHGADMLGLGVSSFSHLGGVHYQNEPAFEGFISRVLASEQPVSRTYETTAEERFIREFVLQVKQGELEFEYFIQKFGIDPRERYADILAKHEADGFLIVDGGTLRATEDGLMQIDRLLPPFFLDHHCGDRYV
ncbi:MAG: oxygen-independent coproporphyrinogen-3 oxidase [Planctomycetota bacterium]